MPVGDGTVTTYTYGAELYEDMIAAIEGAQKQVLLETYIWKGDAVGARFKQALVDAAERGVDVRVIYDQFANLVVRPQFKHFPPSVRVLAFPIYSAEHAVAASGVELLAARLCTTLEGAVVRATDVDVDGVLIRCLDAEVGPRRVLVMLPHEFPALPPSVLVFGEDCGEFQFRFLWRLDDDSPPHERLHRLIVAASRYSPCAF